MLCGSIPLKSPEEGDRRRKEKDEASQAWGLQRVATRVPGFPWVDENIQN